VSVTPTTIETTEEPADRYGEAWNSHDLDVIMAMHTDDTAFELHVLGGWVQGHEAVREAFAAFLTQWPDIHFERLRLHAGGEHWVQESRVTATLARPLEVDGRRVEPTGAQMSFDAVDTIGLVDGLVARKDTYIDAVALLKAVGLPK
jgi:ketosteroid isomerase-like protein